MLKDILSYINLYIQDPLKLVDLTLVLLLAYAILKIVKDSRAWQLVKGIALLVIATWLSRVVKIKAIKLYTISCNELGSYTINYNIST